MASRTATIITVSSTILLQAGWRNLNNANTGAAVITTPSTYGFVSTAAGAPIGGASGSPRPATGWLWPRG